MKNIALLSAILISPFFAKAAPYGMAGCGLGALVFGDQPGKIQIASGILNELISPQTSAITSGTSNCYEGGNDSAMNVYIESNKISLKEDIAKGNGESLDGLLTLLNCQEKQPVAAELKRNYHQIFSESSSSHIQSAIEKTLKQNSASAKSCNAII